MQALINDFHEMERFFFSLVSLNHINYETLILFETGVMSAGLNPVFVKKMDDAILADIAQCKSYYTQKNVPWTIVVPEHAQMYSEQENQLSQEYELMDIGVGMAFTLSSNNLTAPTTPLEFRAMNEDLSTWSIPLIHGYQSTYEITSVYTLRHQEALEKGNGIYHFSGFYAGEVVASVTLTINENQARIDDLATLPTFQKRGFASALIANTLLHALNLNVHTCFLEASNDGLNLYRRLGFQPLFTNHYYEPRTLI